MGLLMSKKLKIDTSKMELLWQDEYRREYLSHISEDEYKIVKHTVMETDFSTCTEQYKQKSVSSKWMCIGGPHNLTRKTREAAGEDYLEYNQANRHSDELRVLLIHKSLLGS